MFYGDPRNCLFTMPEAELRPVEGLSWPALCRYVSQYRPQAWLPELESIAFFQLGAIQEAFCFTAPGKTVEAWLGTVPPLFRQAETQRRFASLRLGRVSRERLGNLIGIFQDVIAAGYEEAWRRERRRWRSGNGKRAFSRLNGLDVTEVFVTHPNYSRLTAFSFGKYFQVFDLLWLYKSLDWKREALIHVCT